MHNRIPGPKLQALHHPTNPSQLLQNGKVGTKGTTIIIPISSSKGVSGTSLSKKSKERRKKFLFAARCTPGVKLIVVLVSGACSYTILQSGFLRLRYRIPIWNVEKSSIKSIKSGMSPFDSHPPKFVSLNVTGNIRHACLQEIRDHRHSFYLSYIENANHVLLVDPAYHSNVGDHMITIAELTLLQRQSRTATTLSQCSYVQAHDFVPSCDAILQTEINNPNQLVITHAKSFPSALSSSTDVRELNPFKVALWHGGGNFGNLWATAQQARIRSIVPLLKANYTIIGMPNSWYYTNTEIESKDIQQLRYNIIVGLRMDASIADTITDVQLATMVKSRIIWTWREHYSYDRAINLLPYCTHQLVPDIAFQLGPYLPARPTLISEGISQKDDYMSTGTALNEFGVMDIVFLLRNDHESLFASVRNRHSIQSILDRIPGASHLSFSIVDWDDRLARFQPNNPIDIYFTETAIQLLSMGIVLICDRLHAAILAYISDLSFIYLDQISGKIHKTFTVAMESGPNCQRSSISAHDKNFTIVADPQKFWSHAETVPGAVEMAVKTLQQHNTMDTLTTAYGRHQRSITREQRRNHIRQKLLNA
jgi:exopolysaccharide biosynthesis predicted pyruvyltransferase EpsI